jgi:hypothetical protein
MDPKRVTVIRGQVLSKTETAIAGVTVTVADHPEYGSTRTRADGFFDIAVNAGGPITLEFAKLQYLPAQRRVLTRAGTWDTLEQVSLVALPSQTASIALDGTSTSAQVIDGEIVSDSRGLREGSLVIAPNTDATMVMEDGTQFSVASRFETGPAPGELRMFAKEYTTGDDYTSSLPGQLPATTMVNYAIELSAVELHELGAKTLKFSKPAHFYVDNFYDLPAGSIVPVGYYDYQKATWVSSNNGLVIDIIDIVNGKAVLLMEKGGTRNDPELLKYLEIDEAELRDLAQRYPNPTGTSLSRVVVRHLTPFDLNFPYYVAEDEDEEDEDDGEPRVGSGGNPDDCTRSGSILYCQSRALGEAIEIPGTGTSLVYKSSRIKAQKTIDRSIFLRPPWPGFCAGMSGNSSVAWEIDVAGRKAVVSTGCDNIACENTWFERAYCRNFLQAKDLCASADENAPLVYTWDGKDFGGRMLSGEVQAEVTIVRFLPGGMRIPYCGRKISSVPRAGYRFGGYCTRGCLSWELPDLDIFKA